MDSTLATQVAELALQILTPILVALGGWLAHRLVGVFEKKTGIDIPERQERMIDDWVERGIHFAEEKSRNLLKEKGEKLKGPEKLEVAGQFVMALVKKNGWDDWAEDYIVGKVESSLAMHRMNGGKPRLDTSDSPDAPKAGDK